MARMFSMPSYDTRVRAVRRRLLQVEACGIARIGSYGSVMSPDDYAQAAFPHVYAAFTLSVPNVRGSQPFLDRPDDCRTPDPRVCLRNVRPHLHIHGPGSPELLAESLGIAFPQERAEHCDGRHFVAIIIRPPRTDQIDRAVDAGNPEIRPRDRECAGAAHPDLAAFGRGIKLHQPVGLVHMPAGQAMPAPR